jgi:ABC-type phosphate transport system permease subunit
MKNVTVKILLAFAVGGLAGYFINQYASKKRVTPA